MTLVENLSNLIKTNLHDKIDSYWKESEVYGTIQLEDLGAGYYDEDRYTVDFVTYPTKTGKRFDANSAKGVYIWRYGDQIMYVGKTDSPTLSIHKRQKSHMRSFAKVNESHESSGRKYREFLEENCLHSMDIVIEYINTDRFGIEGMAELIESATIKSYKPLLNFEIRGKGSR